ncbi:glycosyltransferase family 4 protein [Bacteroides sp. AN502(2024)]|uniref:glycosyltransferase family 4 protein n=1 Tax=Bacteroides sp. AN502(2024) TaxID=3160599 RepID=UPI00351284E7
MKYLILQNTIAPYRNSLFNKMVETGLDIELLYMCEREKERSWKIDYSTMKFPYVVDDKPYGTLCGVPLHWNPKLIGIMRKARKARIIMGSPWNSPDVIAACWLKRIGLLKAEIIFWSEANYLTNGSRKKNWLRDRIRQYVYNTGEGRVIVPGQMAIKTFEQWGIRGKRFIQLPNVIEEDKILPMLKGGHKFTSIDEQPRFVMPVRLDERIKGIMNFFKAIGRKNVLSAQFDILGDGKDEAQIRQFVEDNNYAEHIHLHGFCTMDTVVNHYMNSDCFVLPSYSDPSPLSIVEACCCGLPLLISRRCGNHFETLAKGENGFLFDPDNATQIKTAFESLLNCRKQWRKMGEKSHQMFETNFKQDVVIKRFVEMLENG